jgi:hypothetical protein
MCPQKIAYAYDFFQLYRLLSAVGSDDVNHLHLVWYGMVIPQAAHV